MFYRRGSVGIVGLLYIIVGVFVAWNRGYLNAALVRAIGSALLAILLWWIVLLGGSLHIHG